jgi:hypothetical protein
VDFVVCILAVKKKSGQVSTCRIGPFPCQLLNVRRANDVRQIEIHTAEPIMPDPSPFEFEIVIAGLKRTSINRQVVIKFRQN